MPRGQDDGNALNGLEAEYRLTDTDDTDGNEGDPMVSGGAGMDTIDASSSTADVFINLNVKRLVSEQVEGVTDDPGTTDVDETVEAMDLVEEAIYTGIEQVIGGEGNDTLMGGAATSTTLMGGEGNDTLTGGSKDDMLEGGSGNDTSWAGAAPTCSWAGLGMTRSWEVPARIPSVAVPATTP